MKKETRKTSSALKRLVIVSLVAFVFFACSFVFFALSAKSTGDVELNGFKFVVGYHYHGLKGLVSFSFKNNANVIYFSLSCILYVLILTTIIYIVVGIITIKNKKYSFIAYSFVLLLLTIGVFIIGATGAPKYWAILNRYPPFDAHRQLMLPTVFIIFLGIVFFLLSYICYFLSLVEAYKNTIAVFEEEDGDNFTSLNEKKLGELIRKIVREELENDRDRYSSGRLVIQYFREPNNSKEEKKPDIEKVVVLEDKVLEDKKEEPEEKEKLDFASLAKKPIVRSPFTERLLNAPADTKNNYNEIKNEILSYGVNSRVSNSGDTFRLHKKTYLKITVLGLKLKVYFALDPNNYKESTIPVEDASDKESYKDIPLAIKVKSPLSVRRCKALIKEMMEKDNLSQGEIPSNDWVEELRNQ